MPTTITKRRLMATGAGVGVMGLMGGAQAADRPYDLIVVGGGNSGLPAAIFAAQRGAKVLVLEAGTQVGGTLYLSTGQMSAAGTKLQKSLGIEDTPQIFYDDIMRISKHTADPVLVRLAVENSGPTFDWLTDNGLEVLPGQPIIGSTHEPYSRRRYAWSKDGGLAILNILKAQMQPHLDSGRITLLTSTRVNELIMDGHGAVIGVKARTGEAPAVDYAGRSVALTCGGYTFNPAMFQQYEGAPLYANATYPLSKGAGVTLGLAAGGYMRGGQNHTPLFGAVLRDDSRPSPIRALVRHFPGDRPPWEIYVGADGKRFIQEDALSHTVYEEGLAAQPGERCWVVYDSAIAAQAPVLVTPGIHSAWTPEDTRKAFDTGLPMFTKADTIEDLGAKAGMDPKTLAATVATYNKAQAGQMADPLGRKYMPLPIAQGPFYAVELRSWALTDYAGLAVDGQLRVIRQDGTPIRNLYAAGELLGMGQLMGRCTCGGMSVTPALTFGRLLGQTIVPV
jgi:fumarate reductase flavoprotein subunit